MRTTPEVKVLTSEKEDRWDRLAASHPLGTIYHTTLWKKTIEEAYTHRPRYLYLEDQEGNIICGLPLFKIESKISANRFVCLPCAQACNPLFSNQAEYEVLIKYAKALQSQLENGYIELKTTEEFLFTTSGFSPLHNQYFTFVLDLEPSLDDIRKTFHKSCIQRVLKKTKLSSLVLDVDRSAKSIKEFYRLYAQMRQNYGLLPQPLKFFESIWKNMAPAGYAEVLHARHEGHIVSSLLLLLYKDTVTYEYGASMSDKMHLNPSHFLLWNAIKRAKKFGYRKFDFGRTTTANVGLATFKQRWGTKRQSISHYYLGKKGENLSFREKKSYKNLMSFFVKYSPLWVNSLGGKILYRHLI